MRRQRKKIAISVVDIKRVLKTAHAAGLPVRSLEVRADGTIVLGAAETVGSAPADVFAQWADRL